MDKSNQVNIIKNILNKKNYQTDYVIKFGKYKNMRLDKILKRDRKYLVWLSSQDIHYELKNKINNLLNN